MCSCIAILRVSLVSFAFITLCVPSQRVFIFVYFGIDQSGNFWIHPRIFVFHCFAIDPKSNLMFIYILQDFCNSACPRTPAFSRNVTAPNHCSQSSPCDRLSHALPLSYSRSWDILSNPRPWYWKTNRRKLEFIFSENLCENTGYNINLI
jgi:hypothetical protein